VTRSRCELDVARASRDVRRPSVAALGTLDSDTDRVESGEECRLGGLSFE